MNRSSSVKHSSITASPAHSAQLATAGLGAYYPGPRIAALQGDQHDAWDKFVIDSNLGTFFHQTGWMRAVRDHYGHRPLPILAMEDRQVVGIMPLFLVTGPMTGRALISIPYAVSGGVVARTQDIAAALLAEARRLADVNHVRYLEVRQRVEDDGFGIRDHYFGFRTIMPEDPGKVLDHYPRKARAEIRKARDQNGLEANFSDNLFDVFYDLYVRSLRRLGSPGHSRQFLRRLLVEFGDQCLIQVVFQGKQPVAGVLSFRFRDQILPYFAGIDERYNRLGSSNYLYYSLMQHAVGLGLRVFDFGRTRRDNLGGCQFKINQGFRPEPLTYSYYSPRGLEAPDLRPSNPAFSWSRAAWSRLPLGIAGPMGGLVSRWLP